MWTRILEFSLSSTVSGTLGGDSCSIVFNLFTGVSHRRFLSISNFRCPTSVHIDFQFPVSRVRSSPSAIASWCPTSVSLFTRLHYGDSDSMFELMLQTIFQFSTILPFREHVSLFNSLILIQNNITPIAFPMVFNIFQSFQF